MVEFVDDATDARVLIVGPDADAASFLAAVLNRAGIATRAVATNQAASEVVSAHPPFSVVLLDADTEALRSIRALADPRRAAIPTVMLGQPGAPAAAATEARGQGATFWVERPVDEATLIRGVQRMVDDNPNPGEAGGSGG